MRLQDWEATIQKIVNECLQVQREGGENHILIKWRAKLKEEPTLLEPFQIDEIIREVRRRLNNLSR